MAIIPQNKQWLQPNDGDSSGNIFASWGIDLDKNRGSLSVSKPLKNVFDTSDDADLNSPVAQFVDYDSKFWGISSELFKTSTAGTTDITATASWSQDATSGSPDPGATVTDAVVFDNLLLVQDGDDILRHNGSTWTSWWKGTRGQSALSTGQQFILKVAADGNLYITDGGNKVYRVEPNGSGGGTITKTGEGTLDFSETSHVFICATTTSTRIFYGSEDTDNENAVIVEWDMGPQSISANRIHEMGVKRVLCLATWNDTPIAILSDGTIKYHNGNGFVDWENARLPETNNQYQSRIIHKNGWAIIDNLPHFLINPTVDIDESGLTEDTSQNWFYPAGVYCLDPKVGLYCRFPLNDGAGPNYSVSSVGALHARKHKNTTFFASFEVYDTTTTNKSVIACLDLNNASSTKALLTLIPFESVQNVIKKVSLVHKRLGTGDSIKLYYRRNDAPSVRVAGYWGTNKTFHTTESVAGLEKGWFGILKAGTHPGYTSTVANVDTTSDTVAVITMNDAATVSDNDGAVLEFVNFKHFGTVTNTGVEISDFTIPNPKRSRQVWVLIELNQAAGNDVQLDYLLTD